MEGAPAWDALARPTTQGLFDAMGNLPFDCEDVMGVKVKVKVKVRRRSGSEVGKSGANSRSAED